MSWQNDPIVPSAQPRPQAPWERDALAGPTTRQVLTTAVTMKAEAVAEAERLAKRYPAPPEVILQDIEAYRQQEVLDMADTDLQKAPMLREVMRRDVKVAAMAQDDIPTLSMLEGFTNAIKRGFTRTLQGFDTNAVVESSQILDVIGRIERGELKTDIDLAKATPYASMFAGVGKSPAQLQRMREFHSRRLAENAAEALVRSRDVKTLPASPEYESFQKSASFGEAFSRLGDAPVRITSEVVAESLGALAPAIPLIVGAGVAGGPVALAGAIGLTSAGTEYVNSLPEIFDKLKVDINDIEAVRAAVRTPEFQEESRKALVKAGIIGAFDAATGGVAGKTLSKSPVKNIAAQMGVQAAGGGAGETLGSVAIGEEISPAAVLSEMIGEVPGSVIDVATLQGRRILREAGQRADAIAAGDQLQQALQTAGQSLLRERSPEQFRAVMSEMADGNVYVDGQVLNQLAPEVLNQLPESVREQIATAAAIGDSVEIPVADVLTIAPGTPLEQVIVENARTDPFAMSKADAEAAAKMMQSDVVQNSQRIIQQAQDQEAARQKFETVRQGIEDQLNATGRFRKQVNYFKSFWLASFYNSYGTRSGMGIEEFSQKYFLRILGAPSEQGGPVIEQQKPGQLDGVEVYHWSKEARPVLSSAFYGTGLKGSAREEILSSADQRIRQRLSFYVDKGTGVRPEAGVGGVAHRTVVNNIYDANLDPLKLRSGNAREFESRVLDAGFDGYLDRLEGTQPGQVIMLGERTLQPEVLGPLSRVEAGQQVPALARREAPWQTEASGTPEQLQARLDRMQSSPAWSGYDLRIEGDELQTRKKGEVFEQKAKEPDSNVKLPKKASATTAVDLRSGPRLTGSQKMSIHEVAAFFDKITGKRDFNDPKEKKRAVKQIVAELQYQLQQEKSGLDWYEEDIKVAFEETAKVIPSLAESATKRQLFAVVAGLQSPGTYADVNWDIAAQAFQHYEKTGQIPARNPANGNLWAGGLVSATKEKALDFLNAMMQDLGELGTVEWLYSEHTVKELNEARRKWGNMGPGVDGKASDMKLGMFAFGPKVGPFVMNINGIHELTVDVWATRSFNRYFGQMTGPDGKIIDAPTEPQRRVAKEIFNAAAEQVGIKPYQVQSVLWFFEQQLFNHLGTGSRSLSFSDGARKFAERSLSAPGRDGEAAAGIFNQGGLSGRPQQAGDGAGRYSSGNLAPLEGAPTVAGAAGPDPRLVAVAEQYARDNGIPLRRQAEYAKVDPERAARIAAAYEAMAHDPQNPRVKEAYDDLARQTMAQYQALVAAGYKFWFMDPAADPYQGNPWNAMRDLRANQSMAVFPTESGFGTGEFDPAGNPLLADTGLEWAYGSPDGQTKRVLFNDLFRAVHDAFGHGLEGAGFRAQGEENAWQAHVRLFTGPAVGAITSETRGQNSWLNYGPYGEKNRTAAVEDTVFADQKTGLMPEWTWSEGRVADEQQVLEQRDSEAQREAQADAVYSEIANDQEMIDALEVYMVIGDAPEGALNDRLLAYINRLPPVPADSYLTFYRNQPKGARPWARGWSSWTINEDQTRYFGGRDFEVLKRKGVQGLDLNRLGEYRTRVTGGYSQYGSQGEWLVLNESVFNQQAPTPRGTFNPQTLELVLNPNADLSTWFHETGHFFLEVLADVASQPDAPAQIAEDFGTFTKWCAAPGGEPALKNVEREMLAAEAKAKETGDEADIRYAKQVRAAYEFAVAQGGADYMLTVAQTFGRDVPGQHRIHLIRQFHERWAESIEQYVMEGKAPSVELQGVMRRFAAWIKDAYKRVLGSWQKFIDKQTGDPITLNDDIRRVMDRMLATDEQIAQANEVAGLMPDEQADGEAAERLQKRSMADLKWQVKARDAAIAKLKREAKAIEKQVREEVTAEVDATPEMRAKKALDALQITPEYEGLVRQHAEERAAVERTERDRLVAELYAANPDVTGLKRGQLLAKNKREIANKVDAYMIAWDKSNPKPSRPMNINDADLATVADSFGFESVPAMLEAISVFGSRQEAIDGMTERRMLEEHGDLIDERAITEAANEAVHNEARARSLATELRTQREMLGARTDTGEVNARGARITVNALVEAAKQFGANVISRTPLKDLRSTAWKHTAAERRAGKRWAEATAAGKTEDAVKAKQDQMLNNAAAKSALDAAAESKKILEFFKRVTKGNDEKVVEKGRDPDIVNAARAVLKAYGVETATTKRADEYMEVVQRQDPDAFAALAPMVAAATQNAQPLEALTFEELQGLHEAIEALWFKAKANREMEVDGKRVVLDEVEDELYARAEQIGIPDRIPGEGKAVTASESRIRKLREMRLNLTRVEQWAEAMDGKAQGAFWRYIFLPIKAAADRVRERRVDVFHTLEEATKNLRPSIRVGKIEAPEIGYVFGEGAEHNGVGMAELLPALLNVGNESNKRKLLLGRGWATENPDGTLNTAKWDAFIKRLHDRGILTKEHWDYVQTWWDVLESLKPAAQEAHRQVYGRYFSEITAEPVQTPFGTYRGGYYPAQTDTELVTDMAIKKLAEAENENMSYSFPSVNKGFTKSRVDAYTRPLKLDINVGFQHVDKVILFSEMQPAAQGVGRLLKRKKVSQPLERIMPGVFEALLVPWSNDAAKQIAERPVLGDGGFNRGATILRSRVGMQIMMGNLLNAAQQVSGIPAIAAKIEADGLKRSFLRKSLVKWVAHPRRFSEDVWAQSSYMKDRAENEVAAMADTMKEILFNPTLLQKGERWTRKHAYFLQTWMDNRIAPIAWQAGYDAWRASQPKVDTTGMTPDDLKALEARQHRDAVLYADGLVRQTQGSQLPEDISRFERGIGFVRLFTHFAGYFNMQANTNGASVVKLADQGGLKKNAGRGFYVLMMGLLAPIWIAEAIGLAMRGGPEDEDKDGAVWDDWLRSIFGMGTFRGLVAMVPVFGQAATAAANRFNDNPADDRISVSPAVSFFESIGSAGYQIYRGATGEEVNDQRLIRDLGMAAGTATGLPLFLMSRPVGYLAGVEDDRIQPTSEVDMARGLVTGTASPESKVR